jgi:2-polyprenyl-3-methyl-5-hydroxy-6-metoxy-1,4-benzoquinol methylase
MKLSRLSKFFTPTHRQAHHLSPPITTSKEYAHHLRALVAAPPWCFDFVHVTDDSIEIRGWALVPPTGPAEVAFTLNDIEFDQVLFPLPWAKIGRTFWYWPNSLASGFIARANRTREDVFAHGFATFKYVNSTTLQPLNPTHNYYFCSPEANAQLPIPDPVRRRRVHGDPLASAFLLEGFSSYTKLAHILHQTIGRGFADFAHILDWGCGCGRLTRYFALKSPTRVTGIDIDADNVGWCHQHLPQIDFQHIASAPPTRLAAATFDLIIGISIFTHLREPDQFAWLEELYRLAQPSALVLVSVHGNTTVGRAALSASMFAHLQEHGFLDAGRNADLDGYSSDHQYYRNTFHTEAYIRTHWSQYFDILQIVPGAIGNHQDVVVLRKA